MTILTNPSRLGLALVAVALAAGCGPSRHQLFSPVAVSAQERTGYQVAWHGTTHDAAAREIERMLEGELELEEAIRIALVNNRRLQAAFDQLGITGAELVRATVLPNPEVEAELRYELHGGGNTLELSAMQDMLDLIVIGRRRSIASAELEAARIEAMSAVVDLVADVREAYYRAQANEQRLELRQTVFDAFEASYELAQRLHEAGNISDLDLLRERDLYEQARLELAVARAGPAQSRERLNSILGLWGAATTWELPERLPDLPAAPLALENLEARAVAHSLGLEAERWRMRAAAGELSLARLERWLPGLGIGVSAEREEEGWSVGPAVGIELPLWNWNQAAVRRSGARLSASRNRYTQQAVEVRAVARALRDQLQIARLRAERYRDVVLPLRQQVVDETLRMYNAMAASTFELLAAKRRQVEAAAEYVDALLDYWVARAAADQLLSGGAPDAFSAAIPRGPTGSAVNSASGDHP